MSTSDQELAKQALQSPGVNIQEGGLKNYGDYEEFKPGCFRRKLSPPPEQGASELPNGCHLFWRNGEQGREYFSDEIGGGVQVWHTALVSDDTLLAAILKEKEFQFLEREIERRKLEDGKK